MNTWLLIGVAIAIVAIVMRSRGAKKKQFYPPPIRRGEHAIVIGFGIGGLLSSKMLSRYFDKITVIERDDLSQAWTPANGDTPFSRRGVPQGSQFHNLIMLAHEIIEDLLPGMSDDLVKEGMLPCDATNNLAWNTPYGWISNHPSGLTFKTCTRGLIEHVIRNKVLQTTPNLTVVQKSTVTGILYDKPSNTVTGVKYMDKNTQEEVDLYADIVVDCGGRSSKHSGTHFLKEIGIEVKEESVDAGIGYTSAFYKFNPEDVPRMKDVHGDNNNNRIHCMLVQAFPGLGQTAGFAFGLVEKDVYHFNWYGFSKNHPPTTDDGLLEWSKQLRPADVMMTLLSKAKRISPLIPYREGKTARVRVDQCTNWPENYVMLGDALAYFTPVYGQGITFTSLCTTALAEALYDNRSPTLQGASKTFNKKAWTAVETCWTSAAGGDFAAPGVVANCKPPPGVEFANAYIGLLLRLLADKSTYTPQLHKLVMEVLQMYKGPQHLFHPLVLLQVLKLKLGDVLHGTPKVKGQ